jgi:hypothetical protein
LAVPDGQQALRAWSAEIRLFEPRLLAHERPSFAGPLFIVTQL